MPILSEDQQMTLKEHGWVEEKYGKEVYRVWLRDNVPNAKDRCTLYGVPYSHFSIWRNSGGGRWAAMGTSGLQVLLGRKHVSSLSPYIHLLHTIMTIRSGILRSTCEIYYYEAGGWRA